MRAYLAVIRDSFHEALVSRVLWVLLILCGVFLAFLAPVGITERAGTYLDPSDITDSRGFVEKTVEFGNQAGASAGRRVWDLLDDGLKQRLRERDPESTDVSAHWRLADDLREEINKIIDRPDFYEADAWNDVSLGKEARGLIEDGPDELSAQRRARLNRLLLEAVYPYEIAVSSRRQTRLTYLVWDFPFIPAFDASQLRTGVNQFLMTFTSLVLGVGGVLAAVLVTSGIMPRTFEAGPIDLLLSKPVSRSLVYMAKFFGGCAFILVNATLLIGGLWLLAGLRIGIWHQRFLLCIPLFVFLFMIYYAVSALVGVVWRNAIVSVVLTIVFWGCCFLLSLFNGLAQVFVVNPQRVVQIVPAGEELFAADELGRVHLYGPGDEPPEEVFTSSQPLPPVVTLPLVGPVLDANRQQLLAIDPRIRQFGMLSGPNPLWVGTAESQWQRMAGVEVPGGASELLLTADNQVLIVTPRGPQRLIGDPLTRDDPPKLGNIQMPSSLGPFEIPWPNRGAKFIECGPPGMRMSVPMSASLNRDTGGLALLDRRKLVLLDREDDEKYTQRAELEFDPPRQGIVAHGGDRVMVVDEEGLVHEYDASDLTLVATHDPPRGEAPRFAYASPDGRWFAVVFHSGYLWTFDTQTNTAEIPPVDGQGEIASIALPGNNRMLVAHHLTQITEHRLGTWEVENRRQPPAGTWTNIYRWIARPLHTVLPKPGDLDNMVMYLLSDEKSVQVAGGPQDLSTTRVEIDVWGPIWSNLAFVAVMLAIGCIYVQRKDF